MHWLKKLFNSKKIDDESTRKPGRRIHLFCPECGCGKIFPLEDTLMGKLIGCGCGFKFRALSQDLLYAPSLQFERRVLKPCPKFCGGPEQLT